MKGNIIKDPFLRAALQSCGLICALSVILCAVAAALTRAGVLLPGSLMQAAVVIQGVSVLAGSCIAAKRAPKQKLPAALLAAARARPPPCFGGHGGVRWLTWYSRAGAW